jgi:hypothetical protein
MPPSGNPLFTGVSSVGSSPVQTAQSSETSGLFCSIANQSDALQYSFQKVKASQYLVALYAMTTAHSPIRLKAFEKDSYRNVGY